MSILYYQAVLYHAPLIPAGMESFHWNPVEFSGMVPESAGMALESAGMDQNGTGIDILKPRG